MPLSEREQAMLEQMEQALYAEDPRFAQQIANATPPSLRRRRLLVGALGILLGLGVVLLGVTQQLVWVGVLGFLVMVAAGTYALTTPRRPALGSVRPDGTVQPSRATTRRHGSLRRGASGASANRAQHTGTFMQRLEQRWDDRRARGDF